MVTYVPTDRKQYNHATSMKILADQSMSPSVPEYQFQLMASAQLHVYEMTPAIHTVMTPFIILPTLEDDFEYIPAPKYARIDEEWF